MAYSQLSPQRRILAFVAVAALHVSCLALIVRYTPAETPPAEGAPITVTLVQPLPVVAAPEPRPPQPKPAPAPRVRRPAPPKAPPLIAAPATAPAPVPLVPIPAPAPAPAPIAAAAPVAPPTPVQEAPAPEAQPPVQVSRAGPAEPVPVMPPSFNANYLNNPAPAYPSLSRRMGEEGRVMLRVRVNEQGAPERVELRASSGHPRLDEVALDTVRRWKFVPARRGEQPVAAWVLVPISFNLRS